MTEHSAVKNSDAASSSHASNTARTSPRASSFGATVGPRTRARSASRRRPRDRTRSQVYTAEDQIARLFDDALATAEPVRVEVRGPDGRTAVVDVPLEVRFADVAAMQRYVDELLRLPAVAPHVGGRAVTVQAAANPRGTSAHYQPATSRIHIPMAGRWARRELVLLHELAHHVCAAPGPQPERPGTAAAPTSTPPDCGQATITTAANCDVTDDAASGPTPHGEPFAAAFLWLVGLAMGPIAEALLHDALAGTGLEVAARPPGARTDDTPGHGVATVLEDTAPADREGRMAERVAALLRKAARAATEHEAAAYAAKAQVLATRHAIDLGRAGEQDAPVEVPVHRSIVIGDEGVRSTRFFVRLFLAVARSNGVRCNIARNSTYVVAYGMPSDLDATESMWAALATHMSTAGHAYLARGSWRGTDYLRLTDRGLDQRPHTAATARSAFYEGFIERIGELLWTAHERTVRELPAPQPGSRSGAVVLAERAALVRAYYEEHSKARGTWRASSTARVHGGHAQVAGRAAAERARAATGPRAIGRGR